MRSLTFLLLLLGAAQEHARAQSVSRTAEGFDLPVAPPDAAGFYKSRGFRAGGHLGEDWVTDGGSAKGLGYPVQAIGSGLVVLARDVHVAWGNVVVIRHAWIENRQLRFADSLYAHLDKIVVREGQQISKGKQIGTIGTNHGMYPAHLHFEIHKDLGIGVNHAAGTRDLKSYWLPTEFIMARRHLAGGGRNVPTPSANFLLPTADQPWTSHRFSSRGHTKSSLSKSGHTQAPSHTRPLGTYKVNRYTNP